MLNRSFMHKGGGARSAYSRRHRQMGFAVLQRAPRPAHGLQVATRAEISVYRVISLVEMLLGSGS